MSVFMLRNRTLWVICNQNSNYKPTIGRNSCSSCMKLKRMLLSWKIQIFPAFYVHLGAGFFEWETCAASIQLCETSKEYCWVKLWFPFTEVLLEFFKPGTTTSGPGRCGVRAGGGKMRKASSEDLPLFLILPARCFVLSLRTTEHVKLPYAVALSSLVLSQVSSFPGSSGTERFPPNVLPEVLYPKIPGFVPAPMGGQSKCFVSEQKPSLWFTAVISKTVPTDVFLVPTCYLHKSPLLQGTKLVLALLHLTWEEGSSEDPREYLGYLENY